MTNRNESDADKAERYQKEADKEKQAYEKDPKKAEEAGRKEAFDRMKEGYKGAGLKEDINSMVHPDSDDPVEKRGSGKEGVPAGSEDYAKAMAKQKVGDDGQVKETRESKEADKDRKERNENAATPAIPSAQSNKAKDEDAKTSVDPVDGSKRTTDGVSGVRP